MADIVKAEEAGKAERGYQDYRSEGRMKPEEILERVVNAAINDFKVEEMARRDFKTFVEGMTEDISVHSPIQSSEEFMLVLENYLNAREKAKAGRNIPIADAACYTAEMCLAMQYAAKASYLKDVVRAAFNISLNGGKC
ncbi:MAG: hypothetical protein QME12_04465 [Nanoarchaeota archaeon]|nr:hypothetical protein [Nanoarchaeota archaeon]